MHMRVALIHEYLDYMGGAERVLQCFHRMFPRAPIYTFIWNEDLRPEFPNAEIRTSFLRRFPRMLQRKKKYLLPLLPVVPETFDLSDFDLVISSSSAFAKGVIVKPRTIHICYCHAPSRFLWDWSHNYMKEQRAPLRMRFARPILHYLRMWDKAAAQRVDYFIANSRYTRDRIWKYYRRESEIIYPPVTLPSYRESVPSRKKNYFIIVSRLASYKRVDLAVEAFNKLELPLVIIGDGPERARLQRIARSNVRFLGWLSDAEVRKKVLSASACVFPGEDDFGITIVEALSQGVPVLAYRGGGAMEIIEEGVSGEFFDDPTPEVLADGVRRLRQNIADYSCEAMQKKAFQFSEAHFVRSIRKCISEVILRESERERFEKTDVL